MKSKKFKPIYIVLVLLLGILLFLKPSNNSNNNNQNTVNTVMETKGPAEEILEEISNIIAIDYSPKESVFVVAGYSDDITYFKGYSISAKDIPTETLKKIEPYFIKQGLYSISMGEVGGSQQLGGISYLNSKIVCTSMSGIYAKNFNKETSGLSVNCAEVKNSAPSYSEANDIKLNKNNDADIGELLKDIATKTGISKYDLKEEEVSWPTATITLGLNGGKAMYINSKFNSKDIENYFEETGWINKSMHWTYKPEKGSDSVGYMPENISNKYSGAMCIIHRDLKKIQCGLGPSGN